MGRTIQGTPAQRAQAAKRLKQAIAKRKLSVTSLATATGISASTLYGFINGARDMHLSDITTIGGVLKVNPSWIAWGE